jgi:phosphoserine phosphatase
MYKLNLFSREDLYVLTEMFSAFFVRHQRDLNAIVEDFWVSHSRKLSREMIARIKPDDIIISASPRFLLAGLKKYINVRDFICSELNTESGKLEFACFGQNKAAAFMEKYGSLRLENFYTDSLSDLPMMQLSENTYIVRGCKRLIKYKG